MDPVRVFSKAQDICVHWSGIKVKLAEFQKQLREEDSTD
jgi:hypothetical protein